MQQPFKPQFQNKGTFTQCSASGQQQLMLHTETHSLSSVQTSHLKKINHTALILQINILN